MQGFKYSGKDIDLRLLEKGQEVEYKEYQEKKSEFRKGYAFLGSITNTEYLMLRNYTKPNGEREIYVFKNIEFASAVVMYFRKGYPLLDKFNQLILMLYSNGIMAKWISDSTFFVPQIVSDEPKIFTLSHLIGAFSILYIGLLIALLIFIIEIIIYKINFYNIEHTRQPFTL